MNHDSGRPSSMLRAILWSLVCCTCTGREATSQAAATLGHDTWSAPANVTSLNSAYNDMYAVLTRDGLVVYFTSDRPGTCSISGSTCAGDAACPTGEACSVKGGNDLWTATRASVDSDWDAPVNLTALNGPSDDSLPMLSHSENVMWFFSNRPGGCGKGDLWQTRRQPDGTWGEPTDLGCTVNSGDDETAPAFYADDDLGVTTLYFGSNRPGGVGGYDVYETSTTDEDLYGATWTVPALVLNINSTGRDTRTWIRRDGRELFITSDRAGGAGKLDIWYSTRRESTDPWSPPVPLGTPVNSLDDDGSPSLTWDGDTLYFFSNNRAGGLGGRDIWLSHRQSTR